MIGRLLLAALASAGFVSADCLSFGGEVPGSTCAPVSDVVVWSNPPASLEVVSKRVNSYSPALDDPALTRAVKTRGDATFDFRAPGKHLVELFLLAVDDGRGDFRLVAGDEVVDSRYKKWTGDFRFRPRGRARRIDLLAVVEGPVELTVQTDVDEFLVSAIRWRPIDEFEAIVPQWLATARELHAKPLFHADVDSPTVRRHWLEQLYSRLRLSRDPDVQNEALLGLARVAYWEAAENHEPRWIARTDELLREALQVVPDNPILRGMISASCARSNIGTSHPMPAGDLCESVEPVPWDVSVAGIPADAPEWAASQIRLARRMEKITAWWVENQQSETGELGGGWEDDVEVLRHWGPQALGFGSPAAARGLERIADGIWRSGYIVDGYNRHLTDVEHSSEPTTDSQPLLGALHPDRPEVLERLRATRACADNWIGEQPDGRWRFHSSWFNCKELDTSPERSLDVHLNVRAMGPALWYAALTRDPDTVKLLERWGESWREAMRRTDHGKPAGVIPSAVRAADGSYLVNSDRWDKPDAEWDYFQWSGRSQEALASLFLALHDLTGKPAWLDAAGESFQVMGTCDEHRALCETIRENPESFYEWRRRTGDNRHDQAFGYEAPESDAAILGLMARQAREVESYLGVNFAMFTSEVLFTDRIYYRWPAAYRKYLFGGEAPRGERYPFFSVTWPEADAEFARAVVDAASDRLRLRVYALGEGDATVPLRVWRLRPGEYRWKTSAGGAGVFQVSQTPAAVELTVPAGQDVSVEIARAPETAYWDTQRKGANYFNENPTREWFEAAAAANIRLIRLTFAKWKGERKDFLLGDADDYTGLVEADLSKLIRYLDVANELGVKVIVTPISMPGYRWRQNNNGQWDARLWKDPAYLPQAVRYWTDLAGRLRGHPAVVAYDILNEPAPERFHGKASFWDGGFSEWYQARRGTPADLNRFNREIVAGIRTADPDTPVIVESGLHATPWAFEYLEPLEDDGVVYSFHMYEPYEYTTYRINDGKYSYPGSVQLPGVDAAKHFDSAALDRFFEPVRQWAERHNIPANRIFAGEFGCDRRNQGVAHYLSDLIGIFNREGWHWAFYSYREDAWAAMDYELGVEKPPWAYWQGVEAGDLHKRYEQIYQPRAGNSVWKVLREQFALRTGFGH